MQAARTRVVVDGNNVMGSRPDGWWRDRAGAARRLVAEITPLARSHGGEQTIGFDGREPPRMPLSPECLTVVHTRHGRRDGADDRIVELVHEHPHRAASLVHTSDGKLLTRLQALGTRFMGSGALLKQTATVSGTMAPAATGHRPDPPTALTKVTPSNQRASDHMHRRSRKPRALEKNGAGRTNRNSCASSPVRTRAQKRAVIESSRVRAP